MDLMDTAGFCRNCLSRWYAEAAARARHRADQGAGARDHLRDAVRGVEAAPPDRGPRGGRPPVKPALAALAAGAVLGAAAVSGCGNTEVAEPAEAERGDEVVLTPDSVDKAAARKAAEPGEGKGKVVELRGAGEEKTYGSGGDYVSPGAPTDAEVKADLREARDGAGEVQALPRHHRLPPDRPQGEGAVRRHGGRARGRPRAGQARDPGRQRHRQVPLQVGRRPRRLARQRLRLLGLGLVRAGRRRPAARRR